MSDTTTFQHQVTKLLQAATQHHQAGELEQAKTLYHQVLTKQPDQADALHQLGFLYHQTGQNDQAQDLIQRATCCNPDNPAFYLSLGVVLKESNRLDEAINCYKQALKLKPDTAEIYNNIGNAYLAQDKLSEAVASFTKASALKPGSFEICLNMGGALKNCGQLNESIKRFEEATRLNPRSLEAVSDLLLTMNYTLDYSGEELFERHLDFARRHAEPLAHYIQPHANSRDAERRLRIGYVSPDFRKHAVAYFLEPVLEHHDPEQFEIFAYYNHHQIDTATHRMRQHCHHWRSLVGLTDAQAADLIRADQIDILVDLAGHTAHNRLLLFARKPAPVQVSWLGYPNTTGLSTMDYRITDGFADPVGKTEHLYTEQLVRLPECFTCYQAPQSFPEVGPLPALQNGYVTFGSFNNIAKITPHAIFLWLQILHAVPDSRLLLKTRALNDVAVQQSIREIFIQAGIDTRRLQMLGPDVTHKAHLERYHLLDIGLDTFPYNGTTTTCDTLWMGVPVITLAGDTHVGRVGVSQMQNLGCSELIAASSDEYVAIAQRLAGDLGRLSSLRAGLRSRITASSLMNASRFTKHLETGFRNMWQDWCRKQPQLPVDSTAQ